MKKLFVVLLWISISAKAQRQFEGIITYNIYLKELHSLWRSMDVFVKEGKIMTIGKIEDSSRYSITDFNTGFFYQVEREEKRIYKDSILRKEISLVAGRPDKGLAKKIEGYRCSYTFFPKVKLEDGTVTDMQSWYADSLLLPLPQQYAACASVLGITDGKHICLENIFTQLLWKNGAFTLDIKADKIISCHLPDSLFDLPADFTTVPQQHNRVLKIKNISMEQVSDNFSPPPPPPANKSKAVRKTKTHIH